MREFFVGYFSMPAGLKRLYLVLVPVLVFGALTVGYFLSQAQSAAGQGRWDPANTISEAGRLSVDPYPVLHRADGSSVLLVRPGKVSARSLLMPFAGQLVSLRGASIERGGWRMLEIYSPEDVQELDALPEDEVVPAVPVETRSEIALEGEIVDSKCFLGVMKPGTGKVHRACAALCLTGGMPPMLVVTDAAGDRYGYLLIAADGTSASRQLVPEVAVPVRVTGLLERRGDLTYLRMAPAGVVRLSAVEAAAVSDRTLFAAIP